MLSELKNILNLNTEFSKNVLMLVTGTTVSQIIPIAISPILTRIYTPEDFGILALFMSLSMLFGSVASARYEQAIILPDQDEDLIGSGRDGELYVDSFGEEFVVFQFGAEF